MAAVTEAPVTIPDKQRVRLRDDRLVYARPFLTYISLVSSNPQSGDSTARSATLRSMLDSGPRERTEEHAAAPSAPSQLSEMRKVCVHRLSL